MSNTFYLLASVQSTHSLLQELAKGRLPPLPPSLPHTHPDFTQQPCTPGEALFSGAISACLAVSTVGGDTGSAYKSLDQQQTFPRHTMKVCMGLEPQSGDTPTQFLQPLRGKSRSFLALDQQPCHHIAPENTQKGPSRPCLIAEP